MASSRRKSGDFARMRASTLWLKSTRCLRRRPIQQSFDEADPLPAVLPGELPVHERRGNPPDEDTVRSISGRLNGEFDGPGGALPLEAEQRGDIHAIPA